jgi:mannosyltransferase OCH1-like enzyme
MIEKKIHFIWLGHLPQLFASIICRCRSLHPGWDVKLWTEQELYALIVAAKTGLEHRFGDTSLSASTRSDIARYHVVAAEGGFYLDADMFVLRNFEKLCTYRFVCCSENPKQIGTAFFGAPRGFPPLTRLINHFRKVHYTGNAGQIGGPAVLTWNFKKIAANQPNTRILPSSAFFPVPWRLKTRLRKWLHADLKESYAVHLWAHSWNPEGPDSELGVLARVGALSLNESVPRGNLQQKSIGF